MQLIVYGLALAVLMRLRPQGALPEGFSLIGVAPRRTRRRRRASRWSTTGCRRASHRVSEHVDAELPDRRGSNATRAGAGTTRRSCCRPPACSKRFGGIVAANELAIELRQGTITALVGPNGAGKTTVFNLLTGAIPPD